MLGYPLVQFKTHEKNYMVVVHAFDPSAVETEAGRTELEAGVFYIARSRTVWATERNSLKNPNGEGDD